MKVFLPLRTNRPCPFSKPRTRLTEKAGWPRLRLSRDPVHCGLFAGPADNLDRFFDSRPQATDFSRRIRVVVEVLHVFAAGQRKRIARSVRDLAAPDRDLQPHQAFT